MVAWRASVPVVAGAAAGASRLPPGPCLDRGTSAASCQARQEKLLLNNLTTVECPGPCTTHPFHNKRNQGCGMTQWDLRDAAWTAWRP